jgi:hypothetical protein
MSANASVGEIPWGKVIGIAFVVGLVVYIIYKLNEISQDVQDLADNQGRAKTNPELIDVTPERDTSASVATTQAETAIVTQASPLNVTEPRIHSAQSEQNGLKTYEKQDLKVVLDSEIESDHSAILTPESLPEWRHSEDFRTVYCQGLEHHLTLNQARVVERLWLAYENKTPEVHQSTLLEKLEIYSRRVRDVFKNSTALGTLIVKGEKRGTFRLNLV